jgi:hypothetical protein
MTDVTEPTPEPWHGTISGYYSKEHKCRCDACREAARRYYHEKVKTAPRKPCEVEGCTKNARPRSLLCDGHQKRRNATGSVGSPETLVHNGPDSGYHAAHKRLMRVRGKAKLYVCSQCGDRQAKDWAYLHGSPGGKPAGVTASGTPHGPYSLDPDHYAPMCKPCHKAYDLDAAGKPIGRIRKARMRQEERLAS